MLAPDGRDAEVARMLLQEAGAPALCCDDLGTFSGRLGDEVLCAVVTDGSLRGADVGVIARFVAGQPAWASLPFLVLTRQCGGPDRNPEAARLSSLLQNVTFLERPFHGATFVSIARAALQSRLRQFEARTSEETLRASEEALRQLNETLEERVAQRTAELEQAHALVLSEIAQRQKAEDELRQAQKMEVLGQFTGGVAHDFNNLLMAVMSNLELLSKHHAEDATARRLVDGATEGARRGAALTQRLLSFARRQDLKVEPHNLSELVRASEKLIRDSVGDSVELRFDVDRRTPPALVDGIQFDLALLNLVVNARDAMPDGGVIRIAVDHVNGSEPGPGYVRLRVEDGGQGMDEATLEQAIQPFFSTKELGKGTGLGLSMIHGLAMQLHGRLLLKSAVGVGTTAELWLPASAAPFATEDAPSDEVPPTAVEERPLRILFVDDDALIAMSSVEMLRDMGHEVADSYSAAAALEILESDCALDLMITDFSMPKMNGAQLSLKARGLRPDLPILIATGYAELPEGGELDVPRISKPYGQQQLQAAIRKLLK